MDMKEFGRQLDLYLFMHKITSNTFSQKTGIGTSTISRILKEQIDTLQQPTKEKLSKYFNIPFNEIENNPSIINEKAASSFFKTLDIFKRNAKVIKLLTYKQFLDGDYSSVQTLPVTNDTDINCFGLVVENSDFMTISNGDIIIINPERDIPLDSLNSKTILLKTKCEPHMLYIRKVIVIDDEIFIKGRKAEVFSSKKYEMIGWLTEIRYKR